MTVFARMHIDSARGRSFRVVGPVGGIDVREAVAICVTEHRQEHCAKCGAGCVGLNREFRLRRESVINICAPGLLRPSVPCPYKKDNASIVREACYGAAKVIPGSLAS